MKMDMLIDELQEIVDAAFTLPLSGGKTVVNTERIKEIIDEMRSNLPQELRQAKSIAADRANIIARSKEGAEQIVQQAEERAKVITSESEIVRMAQKKAEEIIFNANNESVKIKAATNAYIDDIMKKSDEQLSENLANLKKTRQSLKALQQKGGRSAKK